MTKSPVRTTNTSQCRTLSSESFFFALRHPLTRQRIVVVTADNFNDIFAVQVYRKAFRSILSYIVKQSTIIVKIYSFTGKVGN